MNSLAKGPLFFCLYDLHTTLGFVRLSISLHAQHPHSSEVKCTPRNLAFVALICMHRIRGATLMSRAGPDR